MTPPPRPQTVHSTRQRFVWAGRVGAAVLRALGRTWRFEKRLAPGAQDLLDTGRPMIYAFYHENILGMAYGFHGRPIAVMVSESEDGEYISQIIHHLGYGTIRGSSTRGGLRSLMEAAKLGKQGHPLGITPDGPKGPRRTVQAGALWIAAKSGCPIVPFAVGARSSKRLASWDRFQIPRPFTRILILAGDPIQVPPRPSAEEVEEIHSPRLQTALDELYAQTDRFESGAL